MMKPQNTSEIFLGQYWSYLEHFRKNGRLLNHPLQIGRAKSGQNGQLFAMEAVKKYLDRISKKKKNGKKKA